MQFVSCSDDSCPLNVDKQCRAAFIAIGDDGKCMIRDGGPFDNKSPTESYVEILECRCQKCNHWELDEEHNMGSCGLRDSLFFDKPRMSSAAPKCSIIAKQITQPGFSAPNV